MNNVNSKAIPESFSIYLDALRFGAALFVLLFQFKRHQLGPGYLLNLIPSRGHDFVILFFVLSGFVIASTTERKKSLGLKQYFIERASRVYSVAIPVLVLSLLLSVLFGNVQDEFPNILLNSIFLGQIGLKEFIPFWNQPFWSLCYEVMYYAIFGCFIFLKGYKRVLWVLFF